MLLLLTVYYSAGSMSNKTAAANPAQTGTDENLFLTTILFVAHGFNLHLLITAHSSLTSYDGICCGLPL
jgi:hypothetical protein